MLWLLFVQLEEKPHPIVLLILNKILEAIAFAQKLSLRFQKHFLSKCFEDLLANVPIEDVGDSRSFLGVELICLLQIVDKVHVADDLVVLGLVELLGLLNELLVEVDTRQEAIIGKLSLAELQVDLDDIPQHLIRSLHDLLAQSLFLHLVADRPSQLLAHRIEYNLLKNLVPLIIQRCNRMHFHIISI